MAGESKIVYSERLHPWSAPVPAPLHTRPTPLNNGGILGCLGRVTLLCIPPSRQIQRPIKKTHALPTILTPRKAHIPTVRNKNADMIANTNTRQSSPVNCPRSNRLHSSDSGLNAGRATFQDATVTCFVTAKVLRASIITMFLSLSVSGVGWISPERPAMSSLPSSGYSSLSSSVSRGRTLRLMNAPELFSGLSSAASVL